ncbi:MAG: tetratricopeptide repeat protein, partial [Methylococcaceae bacterium]|nr:tetratricopeptide repeat protein [Methylococcaceae bacterium]
ATARENPHALHELLAADPSFGNNKLLLVCDQFEDIFRYPSIETAEFIKLLIASSKPYALASGELSNAIYVVLTLRADFLDDYELFSSLAEEVNKSTYELPGLNREQLHSAIEKPALLFDGTVEPELIVQLLDDADQYQVQLPLLQHALLSLWVKSVDKKLTIFDYFALGGLNHILSNHADQLYEALPKAQQSIAKALFKSLIVTGNKQRTVALRLKLSEVAAFANVSWQEVATVVDVFRQEGQGFLLPAAPVALSPDTLLDIAYYHSIQQWSRLNEWSFEETKAAEHYALLVDNMRNNQNHSAGLLRSPELEVLWQWYEETKPTASWAKRYGGDFNSAIDFLQKSKNTALFKKRALFAGAGIALASIGLLMFNTLSKTDVTPALTVQVAANSTPPSVLPPPLSKIKSPVTAAKIPVSATPETPLLKADAPLKTASISAALSAKEASQPLASQPTVNKKTLSALNKRFPNKMQLLQEYKKLNLTDAEHWHKLGDQLTRQAGLARNHQTHQAINDAAIEAYQKSVDLNADDYKAWFNLGDIYRVRTEAVADAAFKESNRDKAITAYSKVANLYPSSDWAFYYLGALYQQQKKFDSAIENYKKQLANTPKHKFAWHYLASAYQKQNKFKAAIAAYQEDLKINPNNADAKKQLNFLLTH